MFNRHIKVRIEQWKKHVIKSEGHREYIPRKKPSPALTLYTTITQYTWEKIIVYNGVFGTKIKIRNC